KAIHLLGLDQPPNSPLRRVAECQRYTNTKEHEVNLRALCGKPGSQLLILAVRARHPPFAVGAIPAAENKTAVAPWPAPSDVPAAAVTAALEPVCAPGVLVAVAA